MKKVLLSAIAAAAISCGAAFADECVLEATAPAMPDPKTATAEDRAATIQAIKDYQAALAPYRDCLNAIADNTELDKDVRQKAINEFNATVKDETKLVDDWQKFDKKYKKENSGGGAG